MNKQEWLQALSNALKGMAEDEKQDILYDYEEHFSFALESGQTEDQVAKSLGDPRIIAKNYRADAILKRAEEDKSVTNIFRAVFAVVSLGFFNLVFVLGPFLAAAGVLFGFIVAGAAMTFAGVTGFFASILSPVLPDLVNVPSIPFGIFASTGLTALGLLWLIGDYYLAKFFYRGVVSYLRMNVRVITK